LSSSCVLCTKCCQFLWIVHSSLSLSFLCLHPLSCVPNVVSFSGLSILDFPSVTGNIWYTRHRMKTRKTKGKSRMDNPEKLETFGTQDTGRRQSKLRGNQEWTIQRNWQHWVHKTEDPLSFDCLRPVSCVPNVSSFSGLSILDFPLVFLVFILCLVYQMLPVSLDCPFFIAPQCCLSSSCVLCTKCCQFLWIVHSTLGTQDTGRRQTKLRGNEEWTIQRNWQHLVHKTQDEDKEN
jgi:hypothetical protein